MSDSNRRFPGAFLLITSVVLALVSVQSVAAQESTDLQLRRGIEALLQQHDLSNATWGIEIRDVETDAVLYERNASRSMLPASTTKLATTAAALEQLGPDFRLRTSLYAFGEIADGVLHGNLVIRGGGDPTIAETLGDFGYAGLLTDWVDSVRAAGIERINGDIVGDDDFFDDVPYGPGWQWDDLRFYYAPEVSGLSYNENVVNFSITGREEGMPAMISWKPETAFVRVRNASITVPKDSSIVEDYRRDADENLFVLASRVPASGVDREALAVYNPTLYFAAVFRETLQSAGIAVRGESRDVDDISIKPDYASPAARRIGAHHSPPLSEIIALVNKPSHNLAAESLLKTIGRKPREGSTTVVPGTWKRGAEVVAETLVRAGVDTSHVRLRDGSGLSRLNIITPRAFGQLLSYMWNHPSEPLSGAFVASLSRAGEDGTLSSRFRAGPAAERVQARTGTMTSVSAIAGYISRSDRSPLSFVIICNHYTAPTRRIRQAQDEMVNLLARLTL